MTAHISSGYMVGSNLNFLFRNQSGEVFERTVILFFGFRREKAARQLATRQM